jgi:RNA recognition motif-containing protein
MNLQQRIPDINKELPQMEPTRSIWIGGLKLFFNLYVLYLGNVTPNLTESVLRSEFGRFGNIETVRMMIQKNCAFITFQNTQEATQAKQYMDKQKILDTLIRVNFGKV